MAIRFVAFLRAINVGGRTVRMDQLRDHFEDLGFADVDTFIASGNVIFEAAGNGRQLEAKIERQLQSRLGYAVATFVRSVADLESVPANQPFPASDVDRAGHRLYVAFLRGEPGVEAIRAVDAVRSPTDDLAVVGRELYWLCRTSSRDSAISGARIEKLVGGPATIRNMNTVNRLIAKYGTA
jgi:uncharacterized protein (DUF1697 family)